LKKNHLRKQLDTIVNPPNKPYYCGSVCNFKWKDIWKFQTIKWKKTKKVKGKKLKCWKKKEETAPGHNSDTWTQ
jgi:hypothetical protein